MSEYEKDQLLRKVSRTVDDERIAKMCDLGLKASPLRDEGNG